MKTHSHKLTREQLEEIGKRCIKCEGHGNQPLHIPDTIELTFPNEEEEKEVSKLDILKEAIDDAFERALEKFDSPTPSLPEEIMEINTDGLAPEAIANNAVFADVINDIIKYLRARQ